MILDYAAKGDRFAKKEGRFNENKAATVSLNSSKCKHEAKFKGGKRLIIQKRVNKILEEKNRIKKN
jgi:hypothetical protein